MDRKKEVSKALERLREGFVSHDILDAVDYLDDVRPIISDEGYGPPVIRSKLLKLHGMAMELITYTSQDDKKRLDRLLTLADDIDDEISDCIDNLEKIDDVISKLRTLGRNEDWLNPEEDEESLDEP
ncbi:MAG: hypothetical protein WA705_30790 [Candidatus Ozemobacteraceae bacterium]|jgi:hypothetical protein